MPPYHYSSNAIRTLDENVSNPWLILVRQSTQGEDTMTKPKKTAPVIIMNKKARAREIVKKMLDEGKSRQEIIQALVNEADITTKSVNTYLYSIQKELGVGFSQSKEKGDIGRTIIEEESKREGGMTRKIVIQRLI